MGRIVDTTKVLFKEKGSGEIALDFCYVKTIKIALRVAKYERVKKC